MNTMYRRYDGIEIVSEVYPQMPKFTHMGVRDTLEEKIHVKSNHNILKNYHTI